MTDDNGEPGYEVGFKRPPKEHRFKKGRSGNPRGRPRRQPKPDPRRLYDLGVATMLEEIDVRDKEGKRRKMAKIAIALELELNRVIEGKKSIKSYLQVFDLLPVTVGTAIAPPDTSARDVLKARMEEIQRRAEATRHLPSVKKPAEDD